MDITTTPTTINLQLSHAFFDDTYACDCFVDFDDDQYAAMRKTKRHYFVTLTETDAHELLDRADFYASSVGDMDDFGLCMSARSTAIAIRKQWSNASKARF